MIYAAHVVALLVTAVVSFVVAAWVRGRTRDRAGTSMAAMLVVNGFWALLMLGELLTAGHWISYAFIRFWHTLASGMPFLWFVFAVYYTGRDNWLSRPVVASMLTIYGLLVGLTLTSSWHGLLRSPVPVTEPFPHLYVEPTGIYWLLVGLSYVYVVLGIGILIHLFVVSRHVGRSQPALLLFGGAAAFATNLLRNAGVLPAQGFEYTVFGAGILAVSVALGLFRTRLFAVAPLARDATFDSIDDAILVVDADRRVVDFNEAARELFPAVQSAVGAPIEEVYPSLFSSARRGDDGPSRALEGAADESDPNDPFAEQVTISGPDRSRTLRLSTSKLHSGGQLRGYSIIARDVTALEEYAAELERKTEQLEEFAGALSHDLRNPVSVATGYAELALDTGDASHVEETMVALERIDETIEDLLALAREGETIDELRPVGLSEIVDGAWTTAETGAATLENDVDAARRVRANPSRLRTLFENLFRNAYEHAGDAPTVRVGDLEDGFFVADDGPGVPPDQRDRIFQYGVTSSDDGTGFGLAIVKSIADAHGWSASVEDGDEGGAEFRFTGVDTVPAAGAAAPESAED